MSYYHAPDYILFLQYHRGRAPASEKWVFGMVDTSHEPALGVMELVPSRDARTLLPIIQQHVQPGTIIWSDEWRAYRRVQNIPAVAQHQTVNHSVMFVDPTIPGSTHKI